MILINILGNWLLVFSPEDVKKKLNWVWIHSSQPDDDKSSPEMSKYFSLSVHLPISVICKLPGNCDEWFQPNYMFLSTVDMLTLFFTLQLYVSVLVHRAYGVIRFRHRKHSVSFRKKSCFVLKYLLWSPKTQVETVLRSAWLQLFEDNMVRCLWCIPVWTYQWFAAGVNS